MKNLLLFISFMIISNLSMSQSEWNGRSPKQQSISANGSVSITINYTNDLFVKVSVDKIDTFSNNCPGSSLTAKRTNDNLEIDFCDQTKSFDMGDSGVKVFNIEGKSISFIKEDGTDGNGGGIDPAGLIKRNIYQDAHAICFGPANERGNVKTVWNIDPSINSFFEDADFTDAGGNLENFGENVAEDKGSGILGFNATVIADGFAKFLVSRVKKELTISFFNKLKKRITGDDFKDAQTLFSSSFSTLKLIDEKIYDIETYLPSLKQSFEHDAEKLPNSFSTIIKEDSSQISKKLDKINKKSRFAISSILDFGIDIKEEKHIGRALAKLDIDGNHTLPNADSNYVGSIKTLRLFSEALRDTFQSEEEPYWIDKEKLDSLLGNRKFLKCFVGLIIEKARKEDISFENKKLADLLDESAADINKIEAIEAIIKAIFNVAKNINKVNNAKVAKMSPEQAKLAYTDYFQYAEKLISVIKPINKFTKVIEPEKVDSIVQLGQQCIGVAKGIATKQYGLGMIYLSNILTKLNNKDGDLDKIMSIVSQEGMFIAQIAEADNSDQVAAIIDNFAAPIGSWRDKRMAKWNFTFDSYVGAGRYFMDKDGTSTSRSTVSTPIGFSLTTPIPLLSNNITIMTSIFDLGPIVAFRFLDSDSEVSDIYLREIIAPGIFLSWNIDKTINRDFLLKLNVGYQQFPLLDEVDKVTNTVKLNKENGFTASINVNVPIMTLINQKN